MGLTVVNFWHWSITGLVVVKCLALEHYGASCSEVSGIGALRG